MSANVIYLTAADQPRLKKAYEAAKACNFQRKAMLPTDDENGIFLVYSPEKGIVYTAILLYDRELGMYTEGYCLCSTFVEGNGTVICVHLGLVWGEMEELRNPAAYYVCGCGIEIPVSSGYQTCTDCAKSMALRQAIAIFGPMKEV